MSDMKNEYYIRLGERIRDRRKKLKMTQSDLCGSAITRNMLSQIENGSAHPSLETLVFLAEKLKVSPSYLVCTDEADEALYRRIDSVSEIRRLYSTAQYEKCAALCRSLDTGDEEITMLAARCELEIALSLFRRSMLSSSAAHIAEAEKLAVDISYFYDRLKASASLLTLLIHSVTSGKMPNAANISELHAAFFDDDSFLYLLSLCLSAEGDTHCLSSFLPLVKNELYKKYMEARLFMSDERFSDALPLLRFVAGSEEADCFTEHFALADLEVSLQKCDMYKEAYECAKRRMSLPDKYSG